MSARLIHRAIDLCMKKFLTILINDCLENGRLLNFLWPLLVAGAPDKAVPGAELCAPELWSLSFSIQSLDFTFCVIGCGSLSSPDRRANLKGEDDRLAGVTKRVI